MSVAPNDLADFGRSPGLFRLTDRQYHSIDLPSSSGTKTLLTGTNAHLAAEREQPREENDAFTLGAYLHALLLDPHSIEEAFIRFGPLDRRTKEGKAEWESLTKRAALNGSRLISLDLVQQADAMAAAVRATIPAAVLLNTLDERETTVIGEIVGRPAKAKMDGIVRNAGSCIVVDIKSTESAAPRDFAASAAKFGYYHQAAFYRRLVEQNVSVMDAFVIIAVEKKPPYLTAVYAVPFHAIETADRRIDELVERWWKVAEGDRTGYPATIQELEPPRWWLGND